MLRNFAIKSNGELWGWGDAQYGALGDNTRTQKSSPISVVGNHVFRIVGRPGYYHSAGIKSDGTAWTWGSNDYGQLGDNTQGTGASKSSPISVVGNHLFIQLSCSTHSTRPTTMGLKDDGTVWAWGNNEYGQLGDNTVTSKSSPISVVGNHKFIKFENGIYNCAALKADGTAWTWGYNANGELGINAAGNKSSPVSVVGNHSFTFLFTNDRVMALKANGECWCWGGNTYGELGDNSKTDRSSPVSVVGEHKFIQISGSTQWSIGLKANGEVWCWGLNGNGQLGDGTLDGRSSPVSVVGNHSFIQIFHYYSGVGGLKANGEVWGWGLNTNGELGINVAGLSKSSPVMVVGNHSFVNVVGFPVEWERNYSIDDLNSLPTNDLDLTRSFSYEDYLNSETINTTYVSRQIFEYGIFEFKDKSPSSGYAFTVTCNLKTYIAPATSTVFLQVYNRTSGSWETLDSDNATGSMADFELSGGKTTSLTDYYDINSWLSCRIYQEAK